MKEEKLLEFLESEISKYDEQTIKAMGSDITTLMHLSGILSGLWIVKSYLLNLTLSDI